MHAIWSRWSPPLERSKLATIAFSGSYFGTVIALPLSGFLAEYSGWSAVFDLFSESPLKMAVVADIVSEPEIKTEIETVTYSIYYRLEPSVFSATIGDRENEPCSITALSTNF